MRNAVLKTFVPWMALAALQGTWALPAATASTFSAELTVNVNFPTSIPLVLGVTANADAFLPDPTGLSDGIAGVTALGAPTSAFSPASNTLTFTAGPVAGFAGPGLGSSSGVSFGTSQSVNLNNLTGAALMVALTGTYSYSLSSTAQLDGSGGAAVSFQIVNAVSGAALFGPIEDAVLSPADATASCFACPIAVTLPLAPGITTVRIDPFVSGRASLVPEPSILLSTVSGVLVVVLSARRRKLVITRSAN